MVQDHIIPEAIVNVDNGFAVSENDSAGTCPRYKVVEGTTFAVDAFKYGDIEGVSQHFLTHYHLDHYMGLKKTFNKPLYASTITAKLVRTFIGVDKCYITEMIIGLQYTLEHGIKVIALDANHCPGAVMFLFKFPCGRCTLHTGHFRATTDMESYSQFWNCTIDTVYLDTTYMKTTANSQLQTHSIDEVKDHVQRFIKINVMKKYLIVVGTYTIGKENVWMSIANTFKMKVWLEESRRKAAITIYGERSPSLRMLVPDKDEANMHVIPLNKVNYKTLAEYSDRVLLGISLGGCEKSNGSKATFTSRVSLIGVQYSEHSSYEELERFMKFLQPRQIIPTVPTSQSSNQMPIIPKNWIYSTEQVKPSELMDTSICIDKSIRESYPLPDDIQIPDHCDEDDIQSLADYMS